MPAHEFSVLSWNVLADAYAYAKNYSYCDYESSLQWSVRSKKIIDFILQYNADIVCLQEVDNYAAFYCNELKALGYASVFRKRGGLKQDGCLIAWKKHRFKLAPASHLPEHIDAVTCVDYDDIANAVTSSKSSPSPSPSFSFFPSSSYSVSPSTVSERPTSATSLPARDDEKDKKKSSTTDERTTNSDEILPKDSRAFLSKSVRKQMNRQKLVQTRLLRHNIGMFVFLELIHTNIIDGSPPTSASTQSTFISQSPSLSSPMPQLLMIANTHLYWNPLYSDVKLLQMSYLLRVIEHARGNSLTHLRHLQQHQQYPMHQKRQEGRRDSSSLLSPDTAKNCCIGLTSVSHDDTDKDRGQNNNESNIPLIISGDLNSTPSSNVYKYIITGQYDARDDENYSRTRLIVDGNLERLAKMLRAVGIDVAYHPDKQLNKGRHALLFERCKREKRILVSKSRSLVARRGCPPYALVKGNQTFQAMFEQVIEHFGFKFQLNRFYSRCTLCNGGFERIAVSEARELDQCPDGLRSGTDENGFSVKFVRCVSSECGQLYWWGGKAAQAASAYRDIFIKVEKKKREMMREMAKQMQGGKSGGGTDGKVEGRSNANFSGNGKEKKSNSNNGARECNDDNSNSRHIDRNPVVKTGVEDEEGDGKDDGDYDAYNDFDDVEDLWAEKGGRDRVHTQWNLNKERGANEHMQNTSVVSTHPGIGSGNSHTTFRAVDDADTVTHAEDNDYITHLSKTLSDVEISTSISSSSSSSFSSSSSVPSSSLLSSDPSLDASTALPALSKTMASLATTSSEIYTGGIRHKLKLRSAFQDYQSLRKDKLLREKISRKMKIKQMMREKAQKENKEKEIDSRTRNSTTSAAPTVRNADNGDEKKKKVRAFEDTRATAVEIKSYFNYDGIRAGSGDVTNDVADGNGTCDASARKNQMKTVNADKSMKSQHINTEKTSSASSLGVSGGASNNEPDFTNYTATFKGCLDYIFFSHSEKDNSDDTDREGGIGRGTEDARGTLLLQSIGCLPTLEQASAHTAFPSPVCPSDHIPLMASFAMSP